MSRLGRLARRAVMSGMDSDAPGLRATVAAQILTQAADSRPVVAAVTGVAAALVVATEQVKGRTSRPGYATFEGDR